MKETLDIIDNKTVRSSLGWEIRVPSIHHLEYEEHGKIIELEIESGVDEKGKVDWVIYKPVVWMWDSMNYDNFVDSEKIEKIVERIKVAFGKLEMKIEEII